jgi:hypothetical protein
MSLCHWVLASFSGTVILFWSMVFFLTASLPQGLPEARLNGTLLSSPCSYFWLFFLAFCESVKRLPCTAVVALLASFAARNSGLDSLIFSETRSGSHGVAFVLRRPVIALTEHCSLFFEFPAFGFKGWK